MLFKTNEKTEAVLSELVISKADLSFAMMSNLNSLRLGTHEWPELFPKGFMWLTTFTMRSQSGKIVAFFAALESGDDEIPTVCVAKKIPAITFGEIPRAVVEKYVGVDYIWVADDDEIYEKYFRAYLATLMMTAKKKVVN